MASINPRFVKAAVRITDPSETIAGTSFMVPRPDNYELADRNPPGNQENNQWFGWYVTCAHVIDGIKSVQTGDNAVVVMEMNELEPTGSKLKISNLANRAWFYHEDWEERCRTLGPIDARPYADEDAAVDVAVSPYYFHKDYKDLTDWWAFPPRSLMPKSALAADTEDRQPLNEGDEIFVIGFPVGFQEDVKNWPAVRHGIVAQIQPYLRGTTRFFLLDASVFGGNSGGPVVTKPQALSIEGTTMLTENRLVGMVSGHKLNPVTKENADLGIVIPIDTINDTIDMAVRKLQS